MKILVNILIFFISIAFAYSQANYPISVGLELGMKTGISVIQTPIGRQNAIEISSLPDIGIVGYYPISENAPLGILAKLDFNNYSYGMKDFGTGQVYKQSMSYISFNPSIFFKGIIFGFGFGLPISANYDGNEIDVANINALYDLRFGYSFDIFYDESARLSLSIIGSYMLKGVINDFVKNDPFKTIIPQVENYEINNSHNPRGTGITLSISYHYLIISE